MKIETAIKEFIIECEVRKYSPRTIVTYRNNLGIFQRFCESGAEVTEIEDVDLSDVRHFTQELIKNDRKSTYINNHLKIIKSFLQYCYEENYTAFNPKKNFKWCKEEKPVVKAFTEKDVKLIMNNCKGNDYLSVRDAAILTMLFETGIRCLELCMIKPSDIHDDYIIINGKNHKQRVVPITAILKKALMRYDRARDSYFAYKSTEDYYFLSFSGRMLTNSALLRMIKVKGEGITDVRISPHTCRHFFTQQQLKMGTDLYSISRLLGHENIRITQTYLNSLRDEDIVKIAKQNSVLMSL